MACLKVVAGSNTGRRFQLDDEALLGRSSDNLIYLPDHRVSRQHARIKRLGTGFVIEDLNSTNGVILQGTRLSPGIPCKLHDGDEIQICSTRLVFRVDLPGSDPQPTNHEGELPPAGPEEIDLPRGKVSLQGDFGSLSLMLQQDDADRPQVVAALDASANMMEVDDHEKQTDKGLQDALKRLQAICQVSAALGVIPDREKLLQRILDCIFDIFPAGERSFIMLQEKDSNTLIPVVAKQRQGMLGHQEKVAISQTIVNEVVTHRRSILSFDAMGDERFHKQVSVINLSIRSMMCAPLLVGEELLGLIQVDTRTGLQSFIPEDLHILTGISAQAAIAIKNMQLYEAVETETARRTSLERYFSPGLVEMLMSGDLTTALGGSTYEGTILFSDIIGFTSMSESMSPTEVVTHLNRYFTIMQKLIYDNGGNVDKFSGDAIMAFWGVPRASQHDVHHAVLTALSMQEKLWAFNLSLESEGQQPIHMGIGLNTGEFVAGNIGSEDKIEFTLIGDTVNLASRIEELAGRSQVLVSETTWSAIQDKVCAIQLPPTTLKGKSKSVTIYSIRAIQDSAHDKSTVALPCHLFDTTHHACGHGMITEIEGTASEFKIHLSTDAPLTPGDVVTIQLAMAEYHDPLCFSATLASCSTAAHEGPAIFTKAVLSGITGSEALAFLTPGSCLITAYSWDDMDRV